MTQAKTEYERRLSERRRSAEDLARRDGQLANARLGVFAVAILLLVFALVWDAVPLVSLLLPAIAFAGLIVVHDRTLRRKQRADDAVRFYGRAIDRVDGRWAGKGITGQDLAPPDHLYAADLDLFGEASLFELLCTARTKSGEEALAGWLSAPADIDEIRSRQRAVDELRNQIDLREDCALLGGDVRARVRPNSLIAWATTVPAMPAAAAHRIAILLSALAFLSACGWAFWGFGVLPLLFVVLIEMAFMRVVRGPVQRVLAAVDEPERELRVLAHVLGLIERAHFTAPKLVQLQQALAMEDKSASERIARLHRLLSWLEAQGNQMFAPIAFVLLWPVHFAFALERWRNENGADVARWLNAVGEFEALCAVSAYAYEHPGDPFPDIAEEGTTFEAKALGHPLIAHGDRVANDVTLDTSNALIIISGSNMSGKSTLLRSVGVNVVLALAGAPVCAESLRLSPLAIGASIRVHDSIQSGTSRFYSEILRLHAAMELAAGDLPVLFLLDEILHGTNSHDRRIGSVAVLKGLLARGAVGLVTTHDLALTDSVSEFDAKAVNKHFEDQIEGDRLVFDYSLREGVVQHSNALSLMRNIGLDV